jgi:hypothetical protein
MDKNNRLSKGIFVTMAITAAVTYLLLDSFLKGNLIEIPKGTREGDMIIVIGMLVIPIGTAILSFGGYIVFTRLKNFFKK